MKQRAKIRGSCFELYCFASGHPMARLGLVVGKRFAKRAVHRNLIKRQARETFRTVAETLPAVDLVLRVSRPMKDFPVAREDQKVWVKSLIVKLFLQVT
ncbi:MAG: ribonuclease P protein component [Rhodocyclaceae bacterium]|nr:ribonuclease P protein component [Rhodocyclaceae bacterium]